MFVTAIVPAAGIGRRLGLKIPKPLIEIEGKPILIRTLQALNRHPAIKEIVLVVNKKDKPKIIFVLKEYRIRKIKAIVLGGRRRQDSVKSGLKEINPSSDIVMIHDAARPFVDNSIISRVIAGAAKSGAAAAGVLLKPTIKQADSKNFVTKTLARRALFEIQTPQAFRKNIILKAYARLRNTEVTDDASLVEKLGKPVKVVSGSYFNIKITTPDDLVFAKAIINGK